MGNVWTQKQDEDDECDEETASLTEAQIAA